MKSIIILGTVLFVTFSAFGIATFIKTKQNHSLDNLYKPTQNQKEEVKELNNQKEEEISNDNTSEEKMENKKQVTKKRKQVNTTVLQAKKQPVKHNIEPKDFSRGEIEFEPPVSTVK